MIVLTRILLRRIVQNFPCNILILKDVIVQNNAHDDTVHRVKLQILFCKIQLHFRLVDISNVFSFISFISFELVNNNNNNK